MTAVPGLHLIGTAEDKASVLSFVLDGYQTEEVGTALNQEGIAVRSGPPLRPTDPAAVRARNDSPAIAGVLQHNRRDRSPGQCSAPAGGRSRKAMSDTGIA